MSIEIKIQRNSEILFVEYGQQRSMIEHRAVDGSGNPIPWYTYPFIEYISCFKCSDVAVFEYGSGHSSFYWASRSRSVTSIEHDTEWMDIVSKKAPKNLKLLLRLTQEAYVNAIREQKTQFDIIIIDGRWRLECAQTAASFLAPGGMIVFDNSDWYPQACSVLREQGFFQCDFSGFGPVNNYTWTTSLFILADARLQKGYVNPVPIGSWKQTSDGND